MSRQCLLIENLLLLTKAPRVPVHTYVILSFFSSPETLLLVLAATRLNQTMHTLRDIKYKFFVHIRSPILSTIIRYLFDYLRISARS